MKKKERYFSPTSEVMELRLEGVIAVSGGGVDPVNNPFGGIEDEW